MSVTIRVAINIGGKTDLASALVLERPTAYIGHLDSDFH
jgi:hypothetical protein